jgi:mono/diheme cytochrome c family protein
MRGLRASLLFVLGLFLLGVVSCAQEQYPGESPAIDAGSLSREIDGGSQSSLPPGSCHPPAAQPLTARLAVISAQAGSSVTPIYLSDLYNSFLQICGGCHGPVSAPGIGGFFIGSDVDFGTQMGKDTLAHITSNATSAQPNAPDDPMPPLGSGGKPWDTREPTDPVVTFVTLTKEWIRLGKPPSFPPPASGDAGASDGGADGGVSPYLLSPAAGDEMTNLGSCIPDKALVAHAIEEPMAKDLDAKFAALKKLSMGPGVKLNELVGLPEDLADTDMFTLDTATLARYGVIAYQPTYPLWSDDAGKLRYVRVPMGQSIAFDKTKQEFVIPDNTRFYKTFMRKIIDTDGSYRWRKIETRLIVARHDTTMPDGTNQQNALFGSYRWNDDETDAKLIVSPLNDGLPFADTLLLFNTDEQLAADVLSQDPQNPELALVQAHAARHYAIPSSERCIECHMGSPSASFILGFRPVQVNRRALGEGGTILEPGQQAPGPDEMTQLQRLIDYGIISGMSSPADVLPLEQSEGSRAPRNTNELVAQGYMVGNCAHCHNPRGYPSVQYSVLANTFDLLPSSSGGIFQFSLEKYSPRITRGQGGNVQIPYITPSLVDLPETPSFYVSGQDADAIMFYAPWRSLIYRNVDTPFTYTADQGLFPHMPMNTPGFDCRAKQVMSDWMVSIPALRKNPETPEYPIVPLGGGGTISPIDDNFQPYVEVLPGDPRYEGAVAAANQRLDILHKGVNPELLHPLFSYVRYKDCPDNSDILDPEVQANPECHPVPTASDFTAAAVPPGAVVAGTQRDGTPTSQQDAEEEAKARFPLEKVPALPHWVVTDLSQPVQQWSPLRVDWTTYLVDRDFPANATLACSDSNQATADKALAEQETAVDLLQSASLDDIRSFATKTFPMGLWQKKPGCDFSKQHKVSDYSGAERPHWMDNPAANAAPDAPVYSELPGAAVFNLICINCHGPLANGRGRLADNLLTMTGGNARVADLRNGLFGPVDSPGSNRQAYGFPLPAPDAGVGAPDADIAGALAAWTGVSLDDRAARYLAWMALGGTDVTIPQPILTIVANTSVLGVHPVIDSSSISANMLAVARSTCLSLLTGFTGQTGIGATSFEVASAGPWFVPDGTYMSDNLALVASNGDAELWLHLCSLGNPPPIRAVTDGTIYTVNDFFPNDTSIYGSNPVGNDQGTIDGSLLDSNRRPYCWRKSAKDYAQQQPPCPDSIDDPSQIVQVVPSHNYAPLNKYAWGQQPDRPAAEMERWATRGAINAGFAVFLYLDAIAKDPTLRVPDYTQCDQLP